MYKSPFTCTVRCTNPFKPGHTGEDYVPVDKKAARNWYLYSPCDGVVYRARKQSGTYDGGYGPMGNYLVIISDAGDFVIMEHLAQLPIVKAGQKVKQGQKIGIAGNTGRSTGRHLHIEISKMAGVPYNAATWWDVTRQHVVAPSSEIDFNIPEDMIMVIWKNGKTREPVYSTTDDAKRQINRIGSLDPYEEAECSAIVDGLYVVVYNTADGKKVGFVKYSGGVKI